MVKDNKLVIKETAYKLFLEHGYKQTSIAKIMKETSLAIGTFYNYYESKDEIFLDIYIDENNKLRDLLIQKINWEDEFEVVLNEILNIILDELSKNKILSEWTKPHVSDYLRRYYNSEKGKNSYQFSTYIQSSLTDQLNSLGADDSAIEEILQAFELIFNIECSVKNDNYFAEIYKLKTLMKYFVLGIKSCYKEKNNEL